MEKELRRNTARKGLGGMSKTRNGFLRGGKLIEK